VQDPGKAASGSLTVPTGAGDHEGALVFLTSWPRTGGEKEVEGLDTPGERMPVAVGAGLGLEPRGGCTAQAGAAAGTA